MTDERAHPSGCQKEKKEGKEKSKEQKKKKRQKQEGKRKAHLALEDVSEMTACKTTTGADETK